MVKEYAKKTHTEEEKEDHSEEIDPTDDKSAFAKGVLANMPDIDAPEVAGVPIDAVTKENISELRGL